MSICKICSSNTQDPVKIRFGTICRDCFEKLPLSVQSSVSTLSAGKLREFFHLLDMGNAFHETSCMHVGSASFSINCVWLDKKPIPLSALEEFSFPFYPKEILPNGLVNGILTVRLVLKAPLHGVLEQELYPNGRYVSASYRIQGRKITYTLSSIMQRLTAAVNNAIHGNLTLEAFLLDEARRKVAEDAARKAAENASKGSKSTSGQGHTSGSHSTSGSSGHSGSSSQNRSSSGNSGHTGSSQNSGSSSQGEGNRGSRISKTDEALAFYRLTVPFSQDELKKARKRLVHKYHPDQPGGSNELCAKVNTFYDVLLPLAS